MYAIVNLSKKKSVSPQNSETALKSLSIIDCFYLFLYTILCKSIKIYQVFYHDRKVYQSNQVVVNYLID